MKKFTKEQVIELVMNAEGLLISTNAGERFVKGGEDCIEFANELKTIDFCGEVDNVPSDITKSPNYEPEWPTFKFSGSDTTDGDVYINIGE